MTASASANRTSVHYDSRKLLGGSDRKISGHHGNPRTRQAQPVVDSVGLLYVRDRHAHSLVPSRCKDNERVANKAFSQHTVGLQKCVVQSQTRPNRQTGISVHRKAKFDGQIELEREKRVMGNLSLSCTHVLTLEAHFARYKLRQAWVKFV